MPDIYANAHLLTLVSDNNTLAVTSGLTVPHSANYNRVKNMLPGQFVAGVLT